MSWALGIDLGGTNVKAVAVTPAGELLHRVTKGTVDVTTGQIDWEGLGRDTLRDFRHLPGGKPDSIGVCAPGLVASDRRSIAHMPGRLAGLERMDWTNALDSAALVPVANDAHAALRSEAWIGAARGRQNVVMFTLGTGVGGAVMCDGRLLHGASGRAGHIGHLSLDPNGPTSIVGMPGALEMLVGDCTVAQRSDGKFATTLALVAAYRSGDSGATVIWQKTVRALGTAIASCINLFDPEIVVLGGGIALAGDALFMPLAAELDRIEWRPDGHRVALVPATLGEWAGAIGAAKNSFS